MVIIEHRCHTVETEAVEAVFLEPELAVTQQEIEHGILAVVEAQRVPSRMLATAIAIEILIVTAVEAPQPLNLIFHGMRMHYVHDNGNATTVSIVDEMLELLGRAKAT